MKSLAILLSVLFFSCNYKTSSDSYDIRADFRYAGKYYSIFCIATGSFQIVKGNGNSQNAILVSETVDSSSVFRHDSVTVFYKKIKELVDSPLIDLEVMDRPRVEIYFQGKKVYDRYRWDSTFWNLFNPIIDHLPPKFNPFSARDRPFSN